jgi:hypothetical protein
MGTRLTDGCDRPNLRATQSSERGVLARPMGTSGHGFIALAILTPRGAWLPSKPLPSSDALRMTVQLSVARRLP